MLLVILIANIKESSVDFDTVLAALWINGMSYNSHELNTKTPKHLDIRH